MSADVIVTLFFLCLFYVYIGYMVSIMFVPYGKPSETLAFVIVWPLYLVRLVFVGLVWLVKHIGGTSGILPAARNILTGKGDYL